MIRYEMKILLIDDDIEIYQNLKFKFKNTDIDYYDNPVHFLDKIFTEKFDLNIYNLIFIDHNYENIGMTSSNLFLSKYIRRAGFINYLVLLSFQCHFDWDKLEQEDFFDEVLAKGSIPVLGNLVTRCERSRLRPIWQKRDCME
jgi:hypothetical protein